MFREKPLTLGIPLYTQETLLKYIGGLHSHLKHTIFMFSRFNFDEVHVQATHIEVGERNISFSSKKEFLPLTEVNKKGKERKATTQKKEEGEKSTSSHYQKKGHEDAKCWKLHSELQLKLFKKDPKGK